MLCFMFERAQGTFALTAGAAGGAPKIAALVLLSVLAGCSSPRQTSKGSAGGAGGQAGGSGKDAGIDLSGTGGNTNPDAKLDADSSAPGGMGGTTVVVPPGTAQMGAACSVSGDCMSSACVDGVCCESACMGPCQACTEAQTGQPNGVCAPVLSGKDPHDDCEAAPGNTCGDDGTCDGAGACRKYGSNQECSAPSCEGSQFQPTRTCTGEGTCGAAAAVDCGAYPCATTGCAKPCAADTDCPTLSFCLDTVCRTKKQNGDSCAAARECTSGKCIDNVCCESACTGSCMACSQAFTGQKSGQCRPVASGQDPDDDCPTDPAAMCGRNGTCDGTGACAKYDSTTTCADATCAGTMFTPARTCKAGACAAATAVDCKEAACAPDGCRQGCTADAQCATTAYCTAMGTCATRKNNGAACMVGNECTSRACVDGVCCESSCTAKCYACSMGKTGQANGKCAPVSAGTDMDNECVDSPKTGCGTEGVCDGAGACRPWAKGTPCAAAMCNTAGNYVPAGTCDGVSKCQVPAAVVCAPTVCTADGCKKTCTVGTDCLGDTYCSGGMCVSKKDQGATCGAATECKSGNCVDGYCCSGTCTDKCNACSMAKTGQPNGRCSPVPAGQDPDNECTQDTANSCGLDGTCNGSNGCRMPAAGTSCGMATCSGSQLTPAGTCSGGTCSAGTPRACGANLKCLDSMSCRTSCTGDDQCTSTTLRCTNGSCVTKCGKNGETCCSTSPTCESNLTCASGTCHCGASGQACCNGTSCDSGLVCSSGKCGAPPCGGSGQACCSGGSCNSGLSCINNSCAADCQLSWEFNSSTEQWSATTGLTAGTGSLGGSASMRLLVSNNGDTATARVSLCRPQNLVSKTIQARIRFEGNMGGSYLTASPLVSEGTRTVGSYGVTTLFPGQWEMMSFDYPTIFPLAPDILDAATEIGFTITGLYGALGSIYIDYVHIIPTP